MRARLASATAKRVCVGRSSAVARAKAEGRGFTMNQSLTLRFTVKVPPTRIDKF
jgi:hypothetical protein